MKARNSQFHSILICLALAFATASVYWPIRHHDFITYDDGPYVSENYTVQQGLTQEGVHWAFAASHVGNWHPVTWLSHMLDIELFGLNPSAHHLVNLFFHVANTLLLFLLFRKMTGAMWRSAFVAALFALHPLHIESVAWIAERKDVLSTFFGLLTIWSYAEYNQSPKSNAQSLKLGGGVGWYSLSVFFFALGLMSKPMLVTLPFVLLLLDFWPLNRMSKAQSPKYKVEEQEPKPLWPLDFRLWTHLFLEKIPFFALAIVSSVLTFIAQKNSGAMATMEQIALPDRMGNVLVSYVAYLGKMFWPRNLAILYPIQPWPLWKIICAAAILVFISATIWKLAKRRPYFFVGWLWYLGTLVPVIGLVHVGNQAMADRYTYLPFVGIFVVLAWGGFDFLRPQKLRAALGIAVIGSCLVLTHAQLRYWKDSETLFEHALLVTENNFIIQGNLGAELLKRGEVERAIALLNQSLASRPNSSIALSNLGAAFEKLGKKEEALKYYEQAVKVDSKNAEAQNNLGFLLLTMSRRDAAIEHCSIALRLRPDFAEAHYNLANISYMDGKMAESVPHYEAAVKYRPAYAEAQSNLGYVLLKLGKPELAIPHLETAVRLKPGLAQAHNNLSETLLRLGKFAEAEMHSRVAVQITPDAATFQNVLGRSLVSQRKWQEAEAVFSRALELKPDSVETHFNLANTFSAEGRFSDAKAHYLSALKLQPEYPEAEMQLAMLFLRGKNNTEAIAHLRKIAEQRPQWKEPINNLAWLLATSADPKLRDATEALTWALQTVRVSPPEDFSALDTLAAAYAEGKQFEQACINAEKALEGARRSGDTNSVAQISARLELYRQSKPYRE